MKDTPPEPITKPNSGFKKDTTTPITQIQALIIYGFFITRLLFHCFVFHQKIKNNEVYN